MNMAWLDWAVVCAVVVFFICVGYYTKRYTRSVADFLAANRCAGRYLLTHAAGMAGLGAVFILSICQLYYTSGFGSMWWNHLMKPFGLVLAMAAWVIYRYRQTRVLTLAELFERRYSRNFRLYAASICLVGGLIGFGVFPAVGANFFIHFCGLPKTYFPFLVVLLVVVSLYFTFIGGQIAVLVTDFLQSAYCNVVLLGLLVLLLFKFPLSDVFDSLKIHEPGSGNSMLNPFDAGNKAFSYSYFLIGYVGLVFRGIDIRAQAYFCSAKTPHEQKMAGILGGFRVFGLMYGLILASLVAYMFMNHPAYAEYGQQARQALSLIENEEVRSQMTVPITMSLYMPIGMMGAFAAVMIAALISTYDTQMHSWGSIFVQDLVLPLRRKPLTNRRHMLLLRCSVIGVGIFAIIFSWIFQQTQHLLFYIALTGAIWMGGCGTVIIGGLYTRWGNTAGAFAGMTTGATIASAGMICHQFWNDWYDKDFPIDGQKIFFLALLGSTIAYTVFSLAFGKRKSFNLDKLLHRGKYRIQGDHLVADSKQHLGLWGKLRKALGYSDEFTLGDKVIYGITVGQMSLFVGSFVVMTSLHFIFNFTEDDWATFFYYKLWYYIITSFIYSVWLGIGGFHNLFQLFRDLKTAKRDTSDDGRVAVHDSQAPNEP